MKNTFVMLAIAVACLQAQWPDTVIATVSTGQSPNDACFSPDGEYVFVAVGFGLLTKISTQTWSVSGVLSLGGTPKCVTCTPGNTVIVADGELGRLLFVDGQTMTLLGEEAIDPGPVEFALAPDGAFAYLSHSGGFASIIDTAAMERIASIWVGNQPGGCHLTPDGQTLYIADNQSPNETALSLPMGPAQRFVSGMDSFDCLLTEGSIYLSNPGWEMLLRVDESTLLVTGSLELPGGAPGWLASTPELPYLFAVSTTGNKINVIDSADFQYAGQIMVGASPRKPCFSPDGAFIAVPCVGANKLYVIGYDPAGVQEPHPGFEIMATGPAGTPEIVLNNRSAASCTITLHDLSGRKVATLHSGPLGPGRRSFFCHGLPSGVYHALVTGELEGSCRLTIIR
ncbi:MAG: YncE family protein [Candidatus Fermentibacteraceae bacterium]